MEQAVPESDNVDKIRDILFGGQMRDYDRRFERLEARLQQEHGQLAQDMENRVKMLDELVKQELHKLTEKLRTERRDRSNALTEMGRRFETLERELAQRLDKLDDSSSQDLKEVRQKIHDLGRDLQERMRDELEQLDRRIEQEAEGLHTGKVSRDGLADLFTEVALRLQGNFELPETQQE